VDHAKMKAAIDTETAQRFRGRSSLELSGMVAFLHQQIVDAEWEITRARASIEAYQKVIEAIERAQRDPRRDEIEQAK
jgi:hypothetical protein